MANLGKYLIVNERAPVTAWPRTNFKLGRVVAQETRKFKNLAEFRTWYREAQHGEAWPNSQYLYTDVLVDSIADRDMRITAAARSSTTGAAVVKNRVAVDGVPFRSTWAAFQALNLGDERECVKFRGELLKARRGEFKGKKFEVIA